MKIEKGAVQWLLSWGVISDKGGVDKTTACYHIAVAISRFEDKRFLAIDAGYRLEHATCLVIKRSKITNVRTEAYRSFAFIT